MSDNRLTPRKLQILKAIVDAHIDSGEPIGSKFLQQQTALTCSSATIRNEMADLESMGYLIQPHTSAGRVPSELGYRLYVNSLIEQYTSTRSQIDEINEQLRYKLNEMDSILREASRLAASFTDYTGIAFKTGTGAARVQRFRGVHLNDTSFLLVMTFGGDIVKTKTVHVDSPITEEHVMRLVEALNIYLVNLTDDEITMPQIMKLEALMASAGFMIHPTIKIIYEAMSELDSADVRLDGITKLLQYPEYSDVSRFRSLLGTLEQKDKLMDVISSDDSVTEDGIHVYIGTESDNDVMQGTSLIYKNISVGDSQLAIGVIGPKRMNYSKVIDMINRLASGIDHALSSDTRSLPSAGKPYGQR